MAQPLKLAETINTVGAPLFALFAKGGYDAACSAGFDSTAGEVLGLHTTITGRPHEVTVETMRPCQLNFVSREDFLLFLKDHSDACLRAAQHVSRDYRDACEVIRAVGSHTISERLAKFLLESAAEGQIGNGVVRSKLTLTHEDIAQLVGTSRETITRTLAEFKKMQIVELKGSTLTIRNKVALGRLVAV